MTFVGRHSRFMHRYQQVEHAEFSPAFKSNNCAWSIEFKAFLKQPRAEDFYNFQSLKLRQNAYSRKLSRG